MSRRITPEELVDAEIERLKKSEAVKLAQKEQRINYRKRQYMYQLRWYEKRGLQLMAQGVTMETLEAIDASIEIEDTGERMV